MDGKREEVRYIGRLAAVRRLRNRLVDREHVRSVLCEFREIAQSKAGFYAAKELRH